MPQQSHDPRLQERFSQLNFIVARRNELLRELFLMMQSKQDFAVGLQYPDQEAFLRRFDLESDNGSIANLKEEELSLLHDKPQPFLHSTPTNVSILVESKPSGSTRTTRSRSNAVDLAKSPSPNLNKTHGSFSSPDPVGRAVGPMEDSDEDNDELDLIGSSAFSIEGERSPLHGKGALGTAEKATMISRIEDLELHTSRSPSLAMQNSGRVEKTPLVREENVLPNEPIESSAAEELAIAGPDSQTVEQPPSVDVEMADDGEIQSHAASPQHLKNEVSTREGHVEDAFEDLPLPRLVAEQEQDTPDVFMDQEPDNTAIPESTDDVRSTIKQENGVSPPVIKPAYIRIPLPPSIQEDILIPAPIAIIKQTSLNLNFDFILEPDAPRPSTSSADKRHYFDPQYPIPPINLLPADFTRKARPTRRKREKEKDGKRDKDDVVPLGLNRWNANITANPVWKKVSRASKCLSTREWGVAMTELRLIRTIERIEHLKEEGRWSFRQPKKHRVAGGLLKTHWDYLLDEMKWMRTDFREERRWKMALAYNISTAVLEWHFAKTPEERQRAGICMKWRSSYFKEDDSPLSMDLDSVEQEQERSNAQLLGITYGSEDEDEDEGEQEKDQRSTIDVLEPAAVIEDALETANDIQPKDEDVDDQSAIDLLRRVPDDTDHIPESSPIGLPEKAHPDNGLKTTSNDPLLGDSKSSSQSTNGDVEVSDHITATVKPSKSSLAPLQERIAYCGDDQLFVDFDSIQEISSKGGASSAELVDALDLRLLFPDLQPLGLLDIPATPGPTDGKKRVEKRSDRDDPSKRMEDTAYTKLYPTGRFMSVKPTLIGPLQPSKRWKDGKWLPMEPLPIAPETDNSTRIPEESNNDLFDGRTNTSSNLAFQLHASSFKDKESRKGGSTYTWTANDDAQLKFLVDKYSPNWPLISECFNSTRHSLLTDRRSANDCLDRWKERWGSERKATLPEAAQASGDDVLVSSNATQMMTRGVKRLAGSASSPTTQGTSSSTEAKKRLRHVLLNESIRKAGKKRAEAAQKLLANQRKPPAIHETHNQFNKLPKLSPAELSRMKAERDLQNSQDIVLARKRQDEQIRQTLLMREQAQRGAAPAVQNQVQPQQPQTPQQQQQQGPQQPQPSSQQVQQQQQLAHQQLAQLQQLQAQQQANQTQRQNIPATTVPNRPTRLAATTNPRPISQQAQLLQHARAMQAPVQMQTATQSGLPQNLLSQAQVAGSNAIHPSGSFYGLPPNLTQEQFLMLAMTAQQHQQQQQQQQGQAGSTFGPQPQ